ALLARRRPGLGPGLRKAVRDGGHRAHYTRMSEYDSWAAVYDDWATDMTEDVPFYVELAREADGPVVELAVGNGRVAIPVARETGKPVIGIDRSPAMLAQARERAEAAGVQLNLRELDMRDFELGEPAALVYCR